MDDMAILCYLLAAVLTVAGAHGKKLQALCCTLAAICCALGASLALVAGQSLQQILQLILLVAAVALRMQRKGQSK